MRSPGRFDGARAGFDEITVSNDSIDSVHDAMNPASHPLQPAGFSSVGDTRGSNAVPRHEMLAALSLLATLAFGPELHPPAKVIEPMFFLTSRVARSNAGYVVVFTSLNATFAQALDENASRVRDDATLLTAGDQVETAAVASNDRAILAVYNAAEGVVAQPLTTRARRSGDAHLIAPVMKGYAQLHLLVVGGRFLLIRSEGALAQGQFIDDDGAASGAAFPIGSKDVIDAASNGDDAFVITGGGYPDDAITYLVSASGNVHETGRITGAPLNIHAAWSGSAFVVTVSNREDRLLFYDTAGNLVRTQLLDIGNEDPAAVIGTGSGVALAVRIPSPFRSDPTSSYAAGIIDAGGKWTSPPISLPHFFTDAIYDGSRFVFVNDDVLVSDLRSPAEDRGSVALGAASQTYPRVATSSSTAYVAWGERDGVHVIRVRNGSIDGDPVLALPGAEANLRIAIAADEERALVAGSVNDRVVARFVSAEGAMSGIIALPAGFFSPRSIFLENGRWAIVASGPPTDHLFIVDDAGHIESEAALPSTSIGDPVILGEKLLLLALGPQSRDLSLNITGSGGAASTPLFIAHESSFALTHCTATDGNDRAVVFWETLDGGARYHTAAIDVGRRAVVHTSDSATPLFGDQCHAAWTGNEFVLVDSYAGFMTFSRDGVAETAGRIPTPIRAEAADIAPLAGGALTAYFRSGADFGAGDVPRVVVRRVSDAPSRTRAARQ